jgi:hypothetical protein
MIINLAVETLINESNYDDIKETYAPILDRIISTQHDINDFDVEGIIEALFDLENAYKPSEFYFEFDGNEYRIINEQSIDGIYEETIKDIVTECYDLNLDKIPSFISVTIDWQQTAQNALADGYGHTFSSYDGSEELINGWWIFRTN